jgi:hypothetical protein
MSTPLFKVQRAGISWRELVARHHGLKGSPSQQMTCPVQPVREEALHARKERMPQLIYNGNN